MNCLTVSTCVATRSTTTRPRFWTELFFGTVAASYTPAAHDRQHARWPRAGLRGRSATCALACLVGGADGRLNKAGAVLVRGSTAPELIVLWDPHPRTLNTRVNVCAHRWLGPVAAGGACGRHSRSVKRMPHRMSLRSALRRPAGSGWRGFLFAPPIPKSSASYPMCRGLRPTRGGMISARGGGRPGPLSPLLPQARGSGRVALIPRRRIWQLPLKKVTGFGDDRCS